MSSHRYSHEEDIGPRDMVPNQALCSNTRGRAPSLFPMTVEQFYTIRADFVSKFKEWRGGSSGKTTAEMAEILEYMIDDFDHFKTAMAAVTAVCFPSKCDLIKHEVLELIKRLKGSSTLGLETEEIMAYIGSAIGRLTLEGKPDVNDVEDDDAVIETYRFVNIHKHDVWDMPELGFTQASERLRTKLWTVYTNVNFSRAGCRCFQCAMTWAG